MTVQFQQASMCSMCIFRIKYLWLRIYASVYCTTEQLTSDNQILEIPTVTLSKSLSVRCLTLNSAILSYTRQLGTCHTSSLFSFATNNPQYRDRKEYFLSS